MGMPRIMALDVGDKTIGVAVSDELGITAVPVTVIKRGPSEEADLKAVEDIVGEYGVSRVIVGIPIMLSGEPGIQAEKVRAFVEKLAKRLRVPIETWDERLTTAEAEKVLLAGDASRAKRRKVIDKLAATLILQSYLQAQRS